MESNIVCSGQERLQPLSLISPPGPRAITNIPLLRVPTAYVSHWGSYALVELTPAFGVAIVIYVNRWIIMNARYLYLIVLRTDSSPLCPNHSRTGCV